jgi:cysteine-S-conjugate beta-lyase
VDHRLALRRSEKWSKYPEDVLPAFVAEMDFALAPAIKEALHAAIDADDLGYIGRFDGLLEAFVDFMARRLDWTVDPEQVTLITDVMVGVEELLLALTSPGDGVIINPPVYPPYFVDIPHARRRVVEVPLLLDGALDVDGIAAAFARGARALLLCNPHNPTGRVPTRDELTAIAAAADEHGAWVISDEIHGPLTFGSEEFVPWLTVSSRGGAVTSASKAFNLAGLKLAMIVTPSVQLPDGLRDKAGYLGTIAAEAAFREGDEWLDETLATIAANHARLPSLLPAGVTVAVPPQASFLTWLDCRAAGLGDDPAAVFLERGRVALETGLRFGSQGAGFARLNVGTTPELLDEAVRRVEAALTP